MKAVIVINRTRWTTPDLTFDSSRFRLHNFRTRRRKGEVFTNNQFICDWIFDILYDSELVRSFFSLKINYSHKQRTDFDGKLEIAAWQKSEDLKKSSSGSSPQRQNKEDKFNAFLDETVETTIRRYSHDTWKALTHCLSILHPKKKKKKSWEKIKPYAPPKGVFTRKKTLQIIESWQKSFHQSIRRETCKTAASGNDGSWSPASVFSSIGCRGQGGSWPQKHHYRFV